MKKILFLINNLDKGGAEKILSNIANFISEDEYKVTVCYFGEKVDYDFSEKINLVKISKIKFNLFKSIKDYKKIINKHASDEPIVISHLNYANYFNIFLSFFIKYKAVIVMHYSLNYYLTTSLKNLYLFPFHFILQKLLFKKSYKAIAVSRAIQSSYKKFINLNSSLIYNPIYDKSLDAKNEFSPFNNNNKINILVVGSFINVKNHIELCKCINFKLKKFCEKNLLQFVFIGDGPLIKKIKDYAVLNKIDHLIIFMGLVDKIQNYYINSDFLISTSKLEGLPTVIIEALCYDKPVISTFQLSSLEILQNNIDNYDSLKHDVNNDIVTLDNGVLYKLGNISQLAKAIIYLVENKNIFKKNKQKRESVLGSFSIENSNQYKLIS